MENGSISSEFFEKWNSFIFFVSHRSILKRKHSFRPIRDEFERSNRTIPKFGAEVDAILFQVIENR